MSGGTGNHGFVFILKDKTADGAGDAFYERGVLIEGFGVDESIGSTDSVH